MRPFPLRRLSSPTLAGVLALAACQSSSSDADTPAPTGERTSVVVVYKMSKTESWKNPDSLAWSAPGQSGFVLRSRITDSAGTVRSYLASLSLKTPLRDSTLNLRMHRFGVRFLQVDFRAMGAKDTLTAVPGSVRYDSVALALLRGMDSLQATQPQTREGLLNLYGTWILAGDARVKGFPASLPVGITASEATQATLVAASKTGKPLAEQAKTWSLGISTDSARTLILELLRSGKIVSKDSSSLFPPPPIRVKVPVSVAGSVQAGGNAVAISGAFEWNKGLGLVAVNTYAIRGKDTLGTVSVNGIPAIGLADLAVALAGKSRIMAGSAAPVGICSLVVVVRDGNGNSARSATTFEILKGAVVPQTPTIRLLSPVDGKVVPFDTTTILVKWIATASNSKIDTVQIGDQMGTQEDDSVWSARVPLPATGKPTVVTARAHSIQNIWAVQSASFTRSTDPVGPNLTWVSPLADTAVESSTTNIVIIFEVQDPSGVDTILVNGASPDSVTKAGVVWKTVSLGASGGTTPISVRLVDGAKNPTVSVRSVARKVDNSLAIYWLPDSVAVLEDSSATLPLAPNCPAGSTCKLQVASADTNLVKVSILGDTALRIVPKGDRNGTTTISVSIATATKQSTTTVKVGVAPINDAPTLSVTPSMMGSPTGTSVFSNWLGSVSPGPSDEASQRIAYQVTVDSGASLVSGLPFVDGTGKLSLTGKGISGVARLAVVVVDNGDSTGVNRNRSIPQYIRVRLDAPPTLEVSDTLVGFEDQRTKSDTVRIDDLENPEILTLDWAILDTTLLPKANLRVKSIPGGYTFDALSAPDSNGVARIAWSLTDFVGNVVRDTSRIVFTPVNDAPVIGKAAGLPDTIVISCLVRDTTLPKLFGDIQWEPGYSTQTGTYMIVLADTAQAHLFYSTPGVDGIQPLADGRLHFFLKPDTDLVVELKVLAKDDGGVINGGVDAGTRPIFLHLTNTVKDADGNAYAFRHMPDGNVWMQSNLYSKPKNGDTTYTCAGSFTDTFYLAPRKPNCQIAGALYSWQGAMNIQKGCDLAVCRAQVTEPWQGLCPTGWHIASTTEWGWLFAATYTSSKHQEDSAYSLKNADEAWHWCRDIPCMTYSGAAKFGNFIVPTGSVAAQQAGNGTNFWVPTVPPNFSGPPDWPPTLAIDYSVRNQYAGVTATAASVRCVRDIP